MATAQLPIWSIKDQVSSSMFIAAEETSRKLSSTIGKIILAILCH